MHTKATTFTLLLVGALVLESGCARWTSGNAGEKDMQPGLGRGGVSGGLSSGRGRVGGWMTFLPCRSSVADGSPLGMNSGEERIGNDTSRSRLELLRKQGRPIWRGIVSRGTAAWRAVGDGGRAAGCLLSIQQRHLLKRGAGAFCMRRLG